MFVCNGENIHPAEVERLIERHPAVQQACVVPVEDEVRGSSPIAFVTRSSSVSEEEIQKFYRQNGRAVECPRRIVFVEHLPLAGTNKIDRKSVKIWARDVEVARKNQK
jgi:long-chain acyl-CoA synthetase